MKQRSDRAFDDVFKQVFEGLGLVGEDKTAPDPILEGSKICLKGGFVKFCHRSLAFLVKPGGTTQKLATWAMLRLVANEALARALTTTS